MKRSVVLVFLLSVVTAFAQFQPKEFFQNASKIRQDISNLSGDEFLTSYQLQTSRKLTSGIWKFDSIVMYLANHEGNMYLLFVKYWFMIMILCGIQLLRKFFSMIL